MDNFLFTILSFTILSSATADKFYHLPLGFTAWLYQEFNSIASENKTNQPISKQAQNPYFGQKKPGFVRLLKKNQLNSFGYIEKMILLQD